MEPHPRGRVTIRDVADDTGLSISTVSRALTGARAVNPASANKVLESASRLGYRPDSIGRSLRTQQTHTLGLVIPDIANPFFPSLVQAIERAARDRGLSVLIADAGNDPDRERDALHTLLDRRVDAVLISPTHSTASRAALAETAALVPTIQVDRVIDESLPFVRVNQARPIEQLVTHLRSTGRGHFAFIGQPTTMVTSFEREVAFTTVMASIAPSEPLRVTRAESGRDAAAEILRRWPETDAIICANDLLGVGALQALTPERGGVAVTGFDDTLIAGAMGLTSVRQPVDDLARAALLAAFDAAPSAVQLDLDCTLILRESTR
jgi:LacI family transcriptional regulator